MWSYEHVTWRSTGGEGLVINSLWQSGVRSSGNSVGNPWDTTAMGGWSSVIWVGLSFIHLRRRTQEGLAPCERPTELEGCHETPALALCHRQFSDAVIVPVPFGSEACRGEQAGRSSYQGRRRGSVAEVHSHYGQVDRLWFVSSGKSKA